jgi:starch synthase
MRLQFVSINTVSYSIFLLQTHAGDDASLLIDENAALRATLNARLDKLDEAERKTFYAEHAALAELASEAGVSIPLLDGAPAAPAPKKAEKQKAAPAPVVAEAPPAPTAEAKVVMKDAGVAAVVEVDRDNTLVFKFGDAETPSLAIANAGKASSMAADGLPGSRAVRRGSTNKAAGPTGGDSEKEPVVFKFDTSKTAAPASVPAAAAAQTVVAAAAAAAAAPAADSSGSSGSESDGEATGGTTTTTTRRRKSPSATATTKTAAKKTTPAAAAKKADPFAAARAAASAEAESHSPATALEGKEFWLYATVPATPVAGALCTFYYNKAQSETLRYSNRIQLQARFNNWELAPAGDGPDRLEMVPAAEGAPRGDGSEFYSVTFTVPTEAYEFNFIFSDGESVFDNNNTQNYTLPVEGPVTREFWIDTAPERAEAAYLARKEAERVAAEKAEAERETAALAADAQRAEDAINELKYNYDSLRAGAIDKSQQDRVRISSPATGTATAGSKITLMYNRTAPGGALSGLPVPEDQSLTLKIGHNGWKSPQDIVMQRAPASAASAKGDSGAEWWQAVVQVPESAVALNFVVNYYEHFDNNNSADYKIAVELPSTAKSVEAWADGMLSGVLAEISATRHAEEKAAADLEAARAASREAVRAKTEEVRRKQMRHVLYTEPSTPLAGKELTIAYNPSNTHLNGAQRVFIKGGYNRWTHPKGYGPIEMTPPAAGASHFSATVTVPKDAYSLDFIFSDVAEGEGRYDNRGGLDYHMPVEGSVVGEPPLYVVHVAAEMAPIAKVGGLGDVVTALGRAVQEAGNQVEVILPRYDFFLQSPLLGNTQYETEFEWEGQRVFVSSCIVEGLRCWFIEPSNGMFATSTVYQGASDAAKFSWFSRAALEFLLRTQRQPDIIHCHDWSTAEVAKNYWTNYHIYGLWKPKVIFTIHNLNYGAAAIGEAAYFSQKFTTVSPSYAGEIGGHPAIASNSGKLSGIRNGIDIDIWNPDTDQFLPKGYTADNVEEGKAAARKALRQRVGLTEWGDKPLVGVVTRLTKQKGTHLIAHSAFRAMDRGAQFVLLGSAPDPKVQAEFNALAQQYGGDNAAFCFAFDEPLSHLIYAACDMILVPSMFEPCGLTQMIAMRYGAVPVVRSTGGLRDTVFDVDTDKARAAWELEGSTDWEADGVDQTNGFAFEGTDEGALDYAMNRALDAYYNDREWFRSLQERVMRQDWSWNKPAIDYIELYYAAMK